MEIWKNIQGYENKYQVSNLGNVKALNYRNTGLEKEIAKKLNKGYLEVALWKNGTRKMALIHRLVAQAFIPNTNNLPQINHKDENKLNNCVENLEWCDSKYNNNYGTRNERMAQSKTKKSGGVL